MVDFAGAIKKATSFFDKPGADPGRISPTHVDPGAIAQLWTAQHRRFQKSERRIRDARALLAGELRAPMPDEFDVLDRERFRADSPMKYWVPRQLAQRLGAKHPRIMRPAVGIAQAAQKASTKIEQFANGLLDEHYPYAASVDLLLNEAEAAVIVYPSPAHWQKQPCLYDTEGETIDQKAYDALSAAERMMWNSASAAGKLGADDGDYVKIRKPYQLTKDGAEAKSADTFDLATGTKQYAAERDYQSALANPIVIELLSRVDFLPINPRFSGKRVNIDGIVTRQYYSRTDLIRREYVWEGMSDHLSPSSPLEGDSGTGDFCLYSYWGVHEDGHPFVVYEVGGHRTRKRGTDDGAPPAAKAAADTGAADDAAASDDDEQPAIIDFFDTYGMEHLPVSFAYGLHFATSNPDQRSLPFTLPFMANWLNADAIKTGLNIAAWWAGFPSFVQEMTPEMLGQVRAVTGDQDTSFTLKPMTVKTIFGKLTEIMSHGANKDVAGLLEMYRNENADQLPPPGAFGGEGPTSGIDRQVLGRDLESGFADVINGARQLYEDAARFALEISDGLEKKLKQPVSLRVMSTSPVSQIATTMSATHEVITLPHDICGGNYDVIAEFPHQPGENLAAAAQWQAFAEAELILREEFRTLAMGDPNPEIFEAKRQFQRWLDSPEGMQDVFAGVADYLDDKRLKKIFELKAQGRATDGGVSLAGMAGLPPPLPPQPQNGGGLGMMPPGGPGGMPPMGPPGMPPPGMGPTGPMAPAAASGPQMDIGNPAASSYAGAVGGALGASVGGAGGPFG